MGNIFSGQGGRRAKRGLFALGFLYVLFSFFRLNRKKEVKKDV
jgi:hypothetical protein